MERKGQRDQEGTLSQEFDAIQRIQLTYQKERLSNECESLVKDFDEQIREMQKEKYRLESDLKNADLKLILLYEELVILQSMDAKDKLLSDQLADSRDAKAGIMKEINDINKRLKEKEKEINKIKEDEDIMQQKFEELCPKNSDKREEIERFFLKITKKRKKTKETKERVEGDEDDEEEEDDVADEPEVNEDEEEEDDETNLVGLAGEDTKIDDIERLREDRLQLYDQKQKIELYMNELEATRKKLATSEGRINVQLKETEEEISDFQKEKMAKLN